MEYSYKFRLYPNKEQVKQIQQTFGCCRFVYNYYLAKRKDTYEQTGKTMNYYACSKDLTQLKKKFDWLKEADATALQSSLRDLDAAYQNFFRRTKNGEIPGYPRFKSKHNHRQSYRCKGKIEVLDNAMRLPKLGKVKCCVSRPVKGRILSATVSQNPSGKYFISLCCTGVEVSSLPDTGAVVGLDIGLNPFVTTSDGEEYQNCKYLQKSDKKLAKLQRQLSRKTKGSKNCDKARLKVARLHEKIANQRQDMLHKLSTEIVKQNDVVCIEGFAVANMVKKNRLAKYVYEVGEGEFKRQLKYKSEWYGKKLVVIDRFYPSNQLCSVCGAKYEGAKNPKLKIWKCPDCGTEHKRNQNSAVNILNEGLRSVK